MIPALDTIAFRCPSCSGRLRPDDGATALRCAEGHVFPLNHGVLDLFHSLPMRQGAEDGADGKSGAILRAIGERLSIPTSRLADVGLLDPVEATGDPFFDAEEEVFIERFGFMNVDPEIVIDAVYTTGALSEGTNWLAVRITNASAFPVSSTGAHPVLLSYHLRHENGDMLDFEGVRSALPVEMRPGQSMTMHLTVRIPAQPARMVLEVLPVQEGVAWMERSAVRLDVTVKERAEEVRRTDAGRPFGEPLDDDLALEFLDRHLASRTEDLVGIEVGGGIVSTLSRWMDTRRHAGVTINNDISTRILKLAALLCTNADAHLTLQSRFDAHRIPLEDGAVDTVLFSRSLHHFDKPVRVLEECRRVLKPNGLLFLMCEPVGHEYDDLVKNLIRQNVNEQAFPLDGYLAICDRAGLEPVDLQVDWGFSLKGVFRPAGASWGS